MFCSLLFLLLRNSMLMEFHYKSNSMIRAYFVTSILFISTSLASINLVSDPGFEIIGANLPNLYNSANEEFSFREVFNGESEWYSLFSGKLKIRTKNDLNTVVMETLNNNFHEKICHNFSGQESIPYELSFDYLIDENIFSTLLLVTFNDEILLYSQISNRETYTQKNKVYLKEDQNIFCFESSTSSESLPIGALIDNITLIPERKEFISFNAFPIDPVNFVQINTDFYVESYQEFYEIQSNIELTILNVEFNKHRTEINSSNFLFFIIEITQQYASSLTSIALQLPNRRSPDNQIITYQSIPSKMPLYLFQSQSDFGILADSKKYLIGLSKAYNSIFLVIKIISFCFIGGKYIYFYYVFMLMCFTDLEFVLPAATDTVKEISKWIVNAGTVNFFGRLLGKEPLVFGADDLEEKFAGLNRNLAEFGLTENIYNMVIDNLIFGILNTAKAFISFYFIFNQNPKVNSLLLVIKNEKVFFEFIYVFSIVAFVFGFICSNGLPLKSFITKINREFCLLVPICIIFVSFIIFIGQRKRLSKAVKKIKLTTEKNERIYTFYKCEIMLNLVENLIMFIMPFSIGFGNRFISTLFLFILESTKLTINGRSCQNNRSFIQFSCVISSILKLLLAFSLLLINIFSFLPTLSWDVELGWISFLKYNSYFLVFGLVVGGFIEIFYCCYRFVTGLMILRRDRKKNQIKNEGIDVESEENMLNKKIDCNEENEIKDKIDSENENENSIKNSSKSIHEQIENPFSTTRERKVRFQEKENHETSNEIISKTEKSFESSKSISEAPSMKKRKLKVKKNISISRFLETNDINEGEEEDCEEIKTERPNAKSYREIEEEKPQIVKRLRKAYNEKGLSIIKKFDPSLRQITEKSEGPDTNNNIPPFEIENENENFS